MMNCSTLAQSVSDCRLHVQDSYLFHLVQTICDVNSYFSTISARASFTQIRKWNKGLVAHFVTSCAQVWNMLYFVTNTLLWHHRFTEWPL